MQLFGFLFWFTIVVITINNVSLLLIWIKDEQDAILPSFYLSDLNKIYEFVRMTYSSRKIYLIPGLSLIVGGITLSILYNKCIKKI